ncbi:MAG TPA: YggU family protein [Gammaproteobacteria bacterium]|nr:YggU family protein [Gammaproteobacteria bacterium]
MSANWYRWQDDTLTLWLRVQPKASRDEIIGPSDDGQRGMSLKIRITAPPVDGQANTQLIKFLAKSFGVAKSRVRIVAGDNGRHKQVRIHSPTRLPPTVPPAE